MPNRLADSRSPYLLQHADNPVDWWPWGEEAFEEARRRDVPVFLSIGYSSCHWCHVMAHESFEDDRVAALLNERFVSIKVDREERPDVDAVYMDAVTALTGRGGWPMSVFLTPDGRPFFGGTYWPKEDRMGMPGFLRVLESVSQAWTGNRDQVAESAASIAEAIGRRTAGGTGGRADPSVADRAAGLAVRAWDRDLGGFGQAPKFPQAMTLEWLTERAARRPDEPEVLQAVVSSLDAMARGGIFDQVGGGFHRYSTDARWLVPHFEKMLYDNALLAPVYAKAAALTGQTRFERTARRTCDYLLREMRAPDGGFYAATDADSEGEEGKFFVWSDDEFREVVASAGADPDRYARYLGVAPDGNWTDPHATEPITTNILHVAGDEEPPLDELDRVLEALRDRREQRVHPGLDDKIITSWNALAVRGLVLTGLHLGLPEYVAEAVRTATFLHDANPEVRHTWKDGEAYGPTLLEDLACLAIACLDLYAATGDAAWAERGLAHAERAVADYRADDGGFWSTAHGAEELYTRPRETWDNATPSSASVMGEVAVRLAGYTGEDRWRELAESVVATHGADAERAPTGFGWFLRVCEGILAGPRELAIVGEAGPDRDLLIREVWTKPRPGLAVAIAVPDAAPVALLEGRRPVDGQPAAYLCREFACERPVTDADALAALLG